jgi:hypothetical protein
MKLFDDFFWKEGDPGSFEGVPEDPQGLHKATGRALGGRRALMPCGPPVAPLRVIPTQKILIYSETPES